MKPFKWRFGAPVGPIPGRAPRRKQRAPDPAEVVAIGVDAAEGTDSTTFSVRTDGGYVSVGDVTEIRIAPSQGARATATNGTIKDSGVLTLAGLEDAMKALVAMKEVWQTPIRLETQFIFPMTFFPRIREENALDLYDRCPMCGYVTCPWWASVKAMRGSRPDWREGAIDVELAHELLLEAGGNGSST